MKRILFLVMIATTTFVGCDKQKFQPQDLELRNHCKYFDEILNKPLKIQVEWLRRNQITIRENDNYIKCIEGFHIMNYVDYQNHEDDYWGESNEAKYTDIVLGDLLKYDVGYDNYLCFDSDLDDNITFRPIKYFSSIASCYSVPFFKSLQLNHPLEINESTILRFTKINIDGHIIIAFHIPGISTGYYDYSHYPTGSAALFKYAL